MLAALAVAAYGPPDTPPAFNIPKPPTPAERACVERWRPRAYLAHLADAATTVAAIESGKGAEGNPLARAVFGKNVKTWEALAFKAAMVGGTEIWNGHRLRRGDAAGVCRTYKLTVGIIGSVALLNLRFHF